MLALLENVMNAGNGKITEAMRSYVVKQIREDLIPAPGEAIGHAVVPGLDGQILLAQVGSSKQLRLAIADGTGKLIKPGQKISWDQAINEVGGKMLDIRKKYGPDSVFMTGGSKHNNEQAYLMRKFFAFWGSNNCDHQARICHSTTVAGLILIGPNSKSMQRGGAFYIIEWGLRGAVRGRNSPNSRYDFIGFRVVVAPPIA